MIDNTATYDTIANLSI